MRKTRKLVAVLVVVCMVATLFSSISVEKYEASEKVGLELLDVMQVTYEELVSGDFVDSGESYSCIIWIEDVELEEAVKAGIDEAEMTREGYSAWSLYDYPYTTYEANGVTYVEVDLDDNESDEYVQTYIEAEREAATELYTEKNNGFIAENFMARDMSVTYVSKYSPCILANMSVSKIAELIELDEVLLIEYIGDGALQDEAVSMTNILPATEIESNLEIIRIDETVERFGVTGSGIKIGQIETYTPDYTAVIKETGYLSYADTHADNVYKIMLTVAPDATYYATGAGSTPATTFARIEWLLDQGVNIINMSAGFGYYNGYNALDKWVDHITYNHDVHFVCASGNDIDYGVSSPGMGYNIITVGAVENTYPYELIYYYEYDETSATYIKHGSAYNFAGQSLSGQRTLKPDMTAPGRYSSCWGTSFSAPLVSASIALMCEYKPALKTQQFIVKAILAATTAQEKTDAHFVTTEVDFRMSGAGLVDIRSAFSCIQQAHYSTSTGKLTNAGDKKTYSMTVTSSDTCMRIAVAHGNRLEYSSSTTHTTPPAALSNGNIGVIAIKIYDPNGNLVLSTYNNSYMEGTNLQVVEFDPREYGTGTYTIEVILKTAAGDNRATNFGMAWR